MQEKQPVLSLKDIRKVYPGVVALDNVSIDFYPGEVHALIGENGAGKSTFIKTITGAHAPDGGTITIDGETYSVMTPALARKHGIECIYQEFNLIDVLSAAENICYGEKQGRFVNQKKMRSIAQKIFDDFGVDINPDTLVRDLTPGHMQIVEIAKAVSKEVRVLILDEPTAPLSVAEVEILFRIVRKLRDQGVAIIFISHRLDEVFELTDRVSILRDGEYITTLNTKETGRAELIRYMVGREMTATFPPRNAKIGDVALELRNLTGNGVKNISFQARRGEILGISGLVGAGRTEIMKVVFGAEKKQWGEILVNGKPADIRSPKDAMHKYGICLIPEDRNFFFHGLQDNGVCRGKLLFPVHAGILIQHGIQFLFCVIRNRSNFSACFFREPIHACGIGQVYFKKCAGFRHSALSRFWTENHHVYLKNG